MKTFERYFFTETLVKLLAATSALGLVIIGNLLSKLLGKVSEGRYPLDVVRPLLIYGAIDALIFLLPFSAMLAVTLTMGRYYRDNEAAAAFALGVGHARICRVLMRLALPLVLLLFVLVMQVSPEGERRYEMIKQMGKQRGDVTMVSPGRFFSPRENTVLFVDEYDRDAGKLSKVFIADLSPGRTLLETAAYGEQKIDEDGVKRLYLYRGQRYEGTPGRTDYRVSGYREHAVYLPVRLPSMPGDDPEEMGFGELLASHQLEARAELHWRLATVVSLPVLMLLAFSLWRVVPVRGRSNRVADATVVFFIYENLMIFVSDRVSNGVLPVLPGVWCIPALAFTVAALLLARRGGARVAPTGGKR